MNYKQEISFYDDGEQKYKVTTIEPKLNRSFKGVWIPKEIWLDKNITWMEKLFLTEIQSLDQDNGCFASNEYFAGFFNLSKGRCSQIINSLINKKYLSVSYIYRKGTKEVEKRILNYIGIKYIKGGIKNIKQGYLENDKDNNTYINNTINNNNTADKSASPEKKLTYNYQAIYNNTMVSIGHTNDDISKYIYQNAKERQQLKNLAGKFSGPDEFQEFLDKSQSDKWYIDQGFTPSILVAGYSKIMLKKDNKIKYDYTPVDHF